MAANLFPPYSLGAGRNPDHLNPYGSVGPSPYGRPPIAGYDGHPQHPRPPNIVTNGLGGMAPGKP